jgi:allophanate hydrolase subunit 2
MSEKCFPSNEDIIIAGGKMKAKIDGQYREHFEFFLVQEGDQWKLRQFAFPDFIDY